MRSHRRGGPAALVALLLVASAALTGCSHGHDQSLLGHPPTIGSVSEAQAQQLLNRRARGIREDRLGLFRSTLDPTDPELLARQRRYFANMEQLPLQTLRYTVLKSGWPSELASPSWGSAASVPQVRVSLQLRGFDSVPVQRITGFAFASKDGKPMILSELTGSGAQFPGSSPSPWDLVKIHVRANGRPLQL